MLLHQDALAMGLYVGAALSAATDIRRTIYAVWALSRWAYRSGLHEATLL